MPRKVRQIEAERAHEGFDREPGKGSHRTWRHPLGPRVTISGKPGDDAAPYQEKQAREAIYHVHELQRKQP